MIEAALVVIAPFAVKAVTNLIKKAPTVQVMNGWRKPVLRAVVAILSLVGAVLTQAIGEGTIDPSMVETTVYTVINAVVATGLYFMSKK